MGPTPDAHTRVTQLLTGVHSPGEAAAALLPLVYAELRALARSRLGNAAGNTLEPTALVNEAYVRLVGSNDPGWQGRGHFFAAAAQAMRNILVDQARRKASVKHGGGRGKEEIENADPAAEEVEVVAPREDMLRLDAALSKLAQVDERKYRVVMLRYFAGLSIEQAANVLGVSVPTVNREWRLARALLMIDMDV